MINIIRILKDIWTANGRILNDVNKGNFTYIGPHGNNAIDYLSYRTVVLQRKKDNLIFK